MVIQCSACQTRFRLADDKIKPEGTRVRCSRCGEVFTVTPPTPEPPPPVSEPAPEPATTPPASEPPPSAPAAAASGGEEFEDWSSFETGAGEPAADSEAESTGGIVPGAGSRLFEEETAGAAAEPGPGGESGEELDFDALSFDEDEPAPGLGAGGSDEIGFETEEKPGEGAFDFGDELQDAGGDEAFTEVSFDAAGGPGSEDELSFEDAAGDEFSFDDRLGAETDDELSFEDEAGGGSDEELSFEDEPGSGDGDEFSFDDQLGAGTSDEFSFDDEPRLPGLGDLEDDDAFGPAGGPAQDQPDEFEFGDEPAAGQSEGDLDFSSATMAEDAPAADAAAAPAPPRPAAERADDGAAKPAKPAKQVRGRRKYARRKRKSGGRLGLLLFILLLAGGGVAGYLYWQGKLPQVDALIAKVTGGALAPAPASQIRINDLNSYFVTNGSVGQLLVIDGIAVNGYQEPRSALAVKGVLFDRAGGVLGERTVYCGNPLSENELQTLSWEKIRERTDNTFGDSLSNLNVAPGKGLPFTIVFKDLPQNLAEFNVEPVDSIAGNQ